MTQEEEAAAGAAAAVKTTQRNVSEVQEVQEGGNHI